MAQSLTHGETALPADWRDLFALTKPRVMSLVVFTALCGLLAAPGEVHPVLAFSSILAIALGAGASGALNQWYEAGLDAKMKRTAGRPLPAGRLGRQTALQFGVGLAAFSLFLMLFASNWQATLLLAASILFYVFVYTMWLKPRTPQNIVIGGAAGAFPPLIGWVAATGSVAPLPVLLFLLIFLWTPPHFWALALFVRSDYAAAGIPMMPVVAGEQSTRRQILFYAIIMAIGAIAPWPLGYTGALYGWTAVILSAVFVLLSIQVGTRRTGEGDRMQPEKRLFAYSIAYLFILFGAVVADHWWPL
ncbi:Protoheme IX farnesyltransferase [uncultured Sphingopyxis sp.]|uniref:Protoheme IX farnesyltransferase n=1 Tax=uncultured Sphingopyxis sp. TaxID=310581 RepID=A0A1Y5PTT4_9SPHN|nr:heme o synthase [uncultured Sphingopyxis sp.]SBV33412.1 Protoheme IX farnesyltransferase [uncultured Sphingopyxis sp.]